MPQAHSAGNIAYDKREKPPAGLVGERKVGLAKRCCTSRGSAPGRASRRADLRTMQAVLPAVGSKDCGNSAAPVRRGQMPKIELNDRELVTVVVVVYEHVSKLQLENVAGTHSTYTECPTCAGRA